MKMRVIPKKIKVRNTVWKCYSMKDMIVALIVFAILFIALTKGYFIFSIIIGIVTIILFMPTTDGIFYTYLFENVKFLFCKKDFTTCAKKEKEKIDSLILLKSIKENGIIEYQNGYYARVIKIGQKNFGMEDEIEQDIDIRFLEIALGQLDLNQTADIVKIDRPVNLDEFSKYTFSKINEVQDENPNITKIKKEILREQIDKIDELNNIQKQYLSDFYIVIYGKNEIDLEHTTIHVASNIHKCGLNTEILKKKETAIFLKYSYSRNFDEREMPSLENEELMKWIKPKEIHFKASRYEIDDLRAAIFSIADFPLRVKNAWGVHLFHIPNTKLVMHIRPIEKEKAIKRIDKCISEMEVKQIISEKASETNSAELHEESMHKLLDHLQAENESLYDVTITITAYDYKAEEEFKKIVRQALTTHQFKVSNLYGLQIEGFKSADISPYCNLAHYERGINSSSVAATFPFVKPFILDKGGILLGENVFNGYPFIFNLWKRGNLYQNSNAMVIGKSGSGKSFFLKNLILNEWANGTRVIILDPEAEYVYLTHQVDGNTIDVGNAKEGKINPFHIYKILTEDGNNASPVVTFHTHLKMLESFFKIVLVGASLDVIELINNLVITTYEKKGITEDTDCSLLKADAFPIFTDLLKTLIEEKSKMKDSFSLRDLRTAELYLKKFVNGRYSDIWNAPSTLEVNSSLIDFNFQSLFANKNNIVANAQMLLIFRFIEQEVINARQLNKNGENVKTLIVCDEAHLFIDAKFPIALDFFYQMNKRIRKYNGSFIPATQNIADWNGNEELLSKTSTILKNSQYNFIFKLSAPDMKDVLDIYQTGEKINDEEQRMIISATTGQAFFIGSTELRSCIQIKAGEKVQNIFEENQKNNQKEELKI